MSQTIDITPEQREMIMSLLSRHLPDTEAWAYGSRIRWTSRPESDLDMVVFAKPEQARGVSDLREAFEESNLPFRVDLFVWDEVPESFRSEIEREHVVLTNAAHGVSPSWPRVELGNLIDLRLSSVDKKSQPEEIPVKLCNYTDVYYNQMIRENMSFMEATASDREIVKCGLSSGDVVITKDSEKYDDIGVPAFVMDDIPGLVCGYHLAILRPDADRIHGRYLFYTLNTPEVQTQFHHYANGITRFGLRKADIGLVEIPLPCLEEQRAIAHILGTLDDKIELNRRKNETLEAMARAIFKDWFVDFGPTRAKVEGHEPYLAPELWDLFPDALDDEDKPVGWACEPLDEIADFLNGLALQKFPASDPDDSLPVIKITELRRGITPKSGRASHEVPDRYIVRDGDFLFSWSGSLIAKFWTDGDGALNQHLFKVTSDQFPSWFYSQWVHHHLEDFRAIAASKATTMGHIQRRHLKEAMTIYPPIDVLVLLGQSVGPLVEHATRNELENRTLAEIRDLLLPKLMSGAIRIRDAEKLVEAVA